MTKPTKWLARTAKTKISLGIRPVWSEYSLSACRSVWFLATHRASSEVSDQTGRIPRLIWVFAGRTSFCWFCHALAKIYAIMLHVTVQRSTLFYNGLLFSWNHLLFAVTRMPHTYSHTYTHIKFLYKNESKYTCFQKICTTFGANGMILDCLWSLTADTLRRYYCLL